MISFFKIIRLPNLLIVVLTQFVLEYLVLTPNLDKAGLSPLLDPAHFGLLVLTTVLIAAAGYIVNDLEDYELDVINKPQKVIIGEKISVTTATGLYWLLVVIGFAIALYLAFYVSNLKLVLLYPAATLGLWVYSKFLKRKVLSGNIIVSLFVAFVAGIVLFAERENFFRMGHDEGLLIQTVFGAYLAFAFLANMMREIIKDMEDKKGDESNGCRTLPIVYGNQTAKLVGSFLGSLLLIMLGFALYFLWVNQHRFAAFFALLTIISPLIFLLSTLQKAQTKEDFRVLSKLIKIIMLFGLVLLIIY